MKKPVVIGLAVVVLAAVVAGGYWWYQSRQDNGLTLYGNVILRVNLSFRVGGALNRWRWTKVMRSKRARCWANWITSRMRLP